jgi:hypothetical protein
VEGGQHYDQIVMNRRHGAPGDDQTAIPSARESCDGMLDRAGVAHVDRAHLDIERYSHGLDGAELRLALTHVANGPDLR